MQITEIAVGAPVVTAVGATVPGAVESGPTSIGGLSVVAKYNGPDVEVIGDRYSIVQKVLPPGGSYQSDQGVMTYMSDAVTMKARFAGLRFFSGDGLAKVLYENPSNEDAVIGLSPNMPFGIVIPYDTGKGSLNCKRGVFMAGDTGVRVVPKFLPAASGVACCCGGLAPIIQSVGGEGTALLAAGGTIVVKELGPNDRMVVDSHSVVAFTEGVTYDVRTVGNFMTCCCGGEGCFNTVLAGPGTVYLQSLSYEKLIRILSKGGGNNGGSDGGGGGGGGGPPQAVQMAR